MQEKVELKKYTTFKIGGPASYLVSIRNVEDLPQALQFAAEKKLPWFVLGGGSNVLFSDAGYRGVILKMKIRGVEMRESAQGKVELLVGAGEVWDELVAYAVERGLYGLENLSYIPGTVGAAPIQNIGAYGAEVSACISSVEVFDTRTGIVKTISGEECQFNYRTSLFKTPEGEHFIVTRVKFLLDKEGQLNAGYKDVEEYFKDETQVTLTSMRNAIGEIRARKFPDLSRYGTAGSYFKNPIITLAHAERLKEKYPAVPLFPVDQESVKVPLAWILDHVLSLKGMREGDVGLFERQPLVVVNYGDATADEIRTLADDIAQKVFAATEINIIPEVVQM